MRYFVTGCAGFIGSHLTERLLARGHTVVGYDNFSTGQEKDLAAAFTMPNFTRSSDDVSDFAALSQSMRNVEFVFHLAGNADIEFRHPSPGKRSRAKYHRNNPVLQAMRETGVGQIAFASSGAVYGDATTIPTPEDAPFPVQTSLYGASKLAAEGLIAAHCAGFGLRGWIFKFVSMLGERYTHGHIFDFYLQLRRDPSRLCVLGNGRQTQVLPLCSRLHRRHAGCNQSTWGRSKYFQSWHGNSLRSQQIDRLDLFSVECATRHRIQRRRARLDWRQPQFAAGHLENPGRRISDKVSIREGVIKTVDYLRTHPHLFAARQ